VLPPSAGIPWNPTLFEQSVVALKREDLEPPTTYRPKRPKFRFFLKAKLQKDLGVFAGN
jgi:hypothetical protein